MDLVDRVVPVHQVNHFQRYVMTSSLKNHVRLQYVVGHCVVFLMAPLIYLFLYSIGYRIRNVDAIREKVKDLYLKHPGPWLICANHLTLIDSLVIAYALAPFYRYMIHYNRLPWNMPEKTNFNTNFLMTLTTFVFKCIPVIRGGDRNALAKCLAKCQFILEKRESLLIFPEGTRSRSGRIDPETVSYGVGGLFTRMPDCHVLCVYLRGEKQTGYSAFPRRYQQFYVDARPFIPTPHGKGLRAQRDCAHQIIHALVDMEKGYDAFVGK